MAGFIRLKNGSLADQKKTGDAIIRLSKSVSSVAPGSEWAKFNADPKAWLHEVGYRYEGPDAGPDGRIPASVNIVPVYDTADTMYVRVPWKGNVDPAPTGIPLQEPSYGTSEASRFPVLLARYFMRKCR